MKIDFGGHVMYLVFWLNVECYFCTRTFFNKIKNCGLLPLIDRNSRIFMLFL